MHIISYHKGANKEYVDFLVFRLIDFLIDKQKEGAIYKMPNRETTMLCEAHLENSIRVIHLKIKTSDDKLDVIKKPKV